MYVESVCGKRASLAKYVCVVREHLLDPGFKPKGTSDAKNGPQKGNIMSDLQLFQWKSKCCGITSLCMTPYLCSSTHVVVSAGIFFAYIVVC